MKRIVQLLSILILGSVAVTAAAHAEPTPTQFGFRHMSAPCDPVVPRLLGKQTMQDADGDIKVNPGSRWGVYGPTAAATIPLPNDYRWEAKQAAGRTVHYAVAQPGFARYHSPMALALWDQLAAAARIGVALKCNQYLAPAGEGWWNGPFTPPGEVKRARVVTDPSFGAVALITVK